MDKRVIYTNATGGVNVVIPAPDCGLTIDEIARKDVPAGIPFKIVDVATIPTDRTFRDAWEADMAVPDGVGIGYDAWAAEQAVQA